MLDEAADLGVLQTTSPAASRCCAATSSSSSAHASSLGMYTNLVTSAIGLSRPRAQALREAGLDHVQVSIQADEPVLSDRHRGHSSFDKKIEAARLVKELGWPLTLNVVLHRQNIDRVEAHPRPGRGARRRPGRARQHPVLRLGAGATGPRCCRAVSSSRTRPRVTRAFRERLRDRSDVIYVIPDYYSRTPSPAWAAGATASSSSAPEGNAWPCLAAHELPLPKANVREHPLAWIWRSSPMFTAFRGTDWMPEPCRSCDRREIDFGGCRCQAFQLTGDIDPHRSGLRALARPRDRSRGGEGRRRRRTAGRREPRRPCPFGSPGVDTMDTVNICLSLLGFVLSLDNFRLAIALGAFKLELAPRAPDRSGVRLVGQRLAPGRRAASGMLLRTGAVGPGGRASAP